MRVVSARFCKTVLRQNALSTWPGRIASCAGCRVGKAAGRERVRRRAHHLARASASRWWARRDERAFAHPTESPREETGRGGGAADAAGRAGRRLRRGLPLQRRAADAEEI